MGSDELVVVEYVDHDCDTPGILPLPEGARFVIARWKCPICGRRWRIKSWASSSEAQSYGWRRPEWTRPKWLRPVEHSASRTEQP